MLVLKSRKYNGMKGHITKIWIINIVYWFLSDYQNGVNYSIPTKMNFLRTKNVKSDYDPVILS